MMLTVWPSRFGRDGPELRHRLPRRHHDPHRKHDTVDVGVYRDALSGMDLGDVSITEVFDINFAEDQHVAQVRIAPQDGQEAVTPETLSRWKPPLKAVDPAITFAECSPLAPKSLRELIWKAVLSMTAASLAIMGLHLASVRMQFAGPARHRAGPRCLHHHRRLCALSAEVRSDDHRSTADDPWLFDQRYRRRVRPAAGKLQKYKTMLCAT